MSLLGVAPSEVDDNADCPIPDAIQKWFSVDGVLIGKCKPMIASVLNSSHFKSPTSTSSGNSAYFTLAGRNISRVAGFESINIL